MALATMPASTPSPFGAIAASAGTRPSRSRRCTAGGQSTSKIPTALATTSIPNASRAPGCAASSATALVTPTIAAPVPIARAWSTTAELVAAQAAIPACWAITAMPAIAQTFPGTYLPRLDTVQIRAAVQPFSS